MTPEQPAHELGVIHGRFQVLHLDHLRYLLAGKRLCRHLVVGITNPDPAQSALDASDPQRSTPSNNPLTYFERYQLVRSALQESGVDQEAFSIVPFPINFPERYHHYVPMRAVFLLSIYDDWGRQKRRMFEALGLETCVLWEKAPTEKGISGAEVRARMVRSEPWEHLVPKGVAALLKQWGVADRIRQMDTSANGR